VKCLDVGSRGTPQRARPAVVADHDHNSTVDALLYAGIDDRLKRRAFMGREYADSQHSTGTQRSASVVPSIAGHAPLSAMGYDR
jgi:hypothetical protein